MDYKRALFLVEGQTEERFIKQFLQNHFDENYQKIFLDPRIILTKKSYNLRYKGGTVKYPEYLKQIKSICNDKNAEKIYSLFDLFGLHESWWEGTEKGNTQKLISKIKIDIADSRFNPIFSIFEFEALLFSNVEIIAKHFNNSNLVDILKNVLLKHDNDPEKINLDKPPSKHLIDLIPQFSKLSDGILILNKIGIKQIRNSCNNFNNFITNIEYVIN